MLITENLSKTYNTKVKKGVFKSEILEVEAVKELNMELRKGQIVGLLGINGAGKTTSIKMLSTLLEPTCGKAEIDGLDLVNDSIKIKKIINMIAGGERMIYWRLTGKENLWYYGQLYNIPEDVLNRRIDDLLSLVDLQHKKDVPVERYSKGMKQRLQIARGLINNPKYIFMDEPTLGLDAPIARELRNYVKKLAYEEGKSILLTSHYMQEVEELCEYIYVLNKGKLIVEGTPRDISLIANEEKILKVQIKDVNDEINNSLICFCQKIDAKISIKNEDIYTELEIRSNNDVTSDITNILFENKTSIMKIYVEEPKLEDAIIKLSGRVESV